MDFLCKLDEKNSLINLNLDYNLDLDLVINNDIIDNENKMVEEDEIENTINIKQKNIINNNISNNDKNTNNGSVADGYNQIIENIFEEKDELYYENLAFQDLRTRKMKEAEYLEYINCRIQSFLTRGKKLFLNYLQNIVTSSNIFNNNSNSNRVISSNTNNKFLNTTKIPSNNNRSFLNKSINNVNYKINDINDEDLILLQSSENFHNNSYFNNDNIYKTGDNSYNNLNNYADNSLNIPYELKDQGNLELTCFIVKEIMHKIIKQAIKNKSPEKKLELLRYALAVEDIEKFASEELEKLEQFLQDYSESIYLMKELKKKKFCKHNNKNVKIKKNKKSFYVIIKKYIFLDKKEADFFRKNRKKMEEKVSNNFKFLFNEYINNINKSRRQKLHRNTSNSGRNNVKINKNFQSEKIPQIQNDLTILQEDRNLLKEIDKKYLLEFLHINHYYEFYLFKDILKEITDQIVLILFTKIKKITKKYFANKLETWLNYDEISRKLIINEFNTILRIKDYENDVI